MTPDLDLDAHAQRLRDQLNQDAQHRARDIQEQQELQALEDEEREALLSRSGLRGARRTDDPRLDLDEAYATPTADGPGGGADSGGASHARRGAGTSLRSLGLYALLVLMLMGGLWFFLLRDRPQRLPGMDLAQPAMNLGEDRSVGEPRVAPLALPDLPDAQASAGSAPPGALLALSALSVPSVGSEGVPMRAGLADAAPAAPGESTLQEHLQRIERLVLELGTQLDAMSAARLAGPADAATALASAAAAAQASLPRPAVTARRAGASAQRSTKPVSSAPPPSPALGAQLLSVDLWNGEPSVIVTSGLPGDTRTRILRPGDVINGVSLKSADPGTGMATFGGSDGRSFTLSVASGG